MEIQSDPIEYREVPVRFLDVNHTFGQSSQLTLRDGDLLEEMPDELRVTRHDLGLLIMQKTHIIWWGVREGVEKVKVDHAAVRASKRKAGRRAAQ